MKEQERMKSCAAFCLVARSQMHGPLDWLPLGKPSRVKSKKGPSFHPPLPPPPPPLLLLLLSQQKMPHALIIAAAVTAGVGAAIAFEVNVFKPWREEHWTEGWADGFRQEWDEFTENVRENFNDITGENRRHRGDSFGSTHQEERRGRGRRDPDQQEEMELRREMDEFSMHEAQTSSVKTRLADEFDQVQGGARLRTGKNVSKGRGFLEDTVSMGLMTDRNQHAQWLFFSSSLAKSCSMPLRWATDLAPLSTTTVRL